ncbi:MAG: TolC family protein [Candidatus Omnitrophica bacterium]|nr:TolC family protein [Candidatus Omnitrophota bacterium]
MKPIKRFIPRALLCIFCLLTLDTYILSAQDSKPLFFERQLLSLEECIRFALENSFEVKLAQLDFLIVQTDKDSVASVFDSVLSADINYSDDKRALLSTLSDVHTRENVYAVEASKKFPTGTGLTLSFSDTRISSNLSSVLTTPAHTAQGTLEIRQPLARNFFGRIDRGNISATAIAVQNADLSTKERIEILIALIEEYYWGWAFSKKNLEIHRQILERAKKLQETNRKNYDIGNIEKGDFLASQANVLTRKKDVFIAKDKYQRSEANLKLLINMDAGRSIRPGEKLGYKKLDLNLESCINEAFQKRRDYQQAKKKLEMRNIILKTKGNERWPEVDLVASMAVNGINGKFRKAAGKISGENNRDYYLGVEISLPLENNLAESEFKKALYEKENAILTLKDVERRIVTEVGNAFRDYRTRETNLTISMKVEDLQREKLKEEGKRFGHGRSNTKRLIDYQQDYLSAQLEVARGIVELEASRINLDRTLNVILERYKDVL